MDLDLNSHDGGFGGSPLPIRLLFHSKVPREASVTAESGRPGADHGHGLRLMRGWARLLG
jgi:hypothetical protein